MGLVTIRLLIEIPATGMATVFPEEKCVFVPVIVTAVGVPAEIVDGTTLTSTGCPTGRSALKRPLMMKIAI